MASFSSFSVRGSEGKKSSFCSSLYNEIIIDDEKKMNIWHILICTLSLLLTLTAYALFRHNQSVSTKNNRINKNAILPLYQKLLLFYILSVTFTLFLWCLEYSFDSCWTSQSKYWWLTILCAFQTSLKRFFELFIALFISGKSSGLIAIKQSIWRSLIVSILLFIIYFFMYSAGYIAYPFQAEVFYIVSELIYFSILLSILWYCCCHHWLRMSNIYILLISTLVLESLYIISWLMVRLSFDGYCLNDIGDLLGIIIFPILIIYVIRADSYFWRTIFQRLSASTRITKSFGGSRKSFQQLSTRLSDEGGRFGYTPMADFLSMQVPIIDFANLKVGTNPVGHGSTSMVYPALLDSSRLVAAKVFSLDRITIKSVADFFRETLLSAEIDHPNVVKFVGCCIRPPEICLVYEICSHGDLASFIFSQNKTLLEYSTYASTFTLNTARTDGNGLHKRDGSGYDIESTEFNVESTDTPQLPLRGMEYQTVALLRDLSDNTPIPSVAASPLTSQRLAPQPQKTSVISVGAYKKPFDSPTDDSTINTNKYANDMQPHDEIINSLKAKMANMEYNGQTMGGSVSISATNVLLNLRLRLFLLFDISKGMAFLHKRNILHRDLKTANVLVHFEPEQGRFLAKVCDFGSSRNAYATMADSESKKGTHRVREDLSLTNYKNAKSLKPKNKSQTKSKRIPQILANVRKLKLNKSSETVRTKNVKQNPFHYTAVPRTASVTDDSAFDEHELPSTSMTATSTRFDTTTAGNTYGNAYGASSRSELLPEPIRTLSSVAYTAPENLGHIDFSAYERASLSRKNIKDAKPYYNKTKKKFTVTKCEDVIVTPVIAPFERNVLGISMSVEKNSEDREVSVASEPMPIEMNDDGMSKDMSHRIGMSEEIDLKTAFKADVFSFAVIIWEVICMKPIYEEKNMIQIRDMILSGNRMNLTEFDDLIYLNPNKSKKDAERNRYKKIQQLMTDCWQQNAKFRPNFQEIVKIISCIIYDK